MARPVVYLLLPTASKAEAAEARRAIGPGATVYIGLASAHAPGQALTGDVVVVGEGAQSVENDATGRVTRYPDMAALLAGHEPAQEPERQRPVATDEYGEAVQGASDATDGQAEAAAAETAPDNEALKAGVRELTRPPAANGRASAEKADPVAGMDRPAMIQHAAKTWPGARQWATMKTDDLASTIRQMTAEAR